MELIIITGMSGAGKTTAIHILEDMGFYCTDNIPPMLMTELATAVASSKSMNFNKLAMVADIRMGQLLDGLLPQINVMRNLGFDIKLLFLDASDDSLIKRYNLTKRTHPLSIGTSVLNGIKNERKALEELRSIANMIIDTSSLNEKSFKEKMRSCFLQDGETRGVVRLISFGFKRGMPLDLDMMFDVRFLPNPFYEPELCEFNGLDKKIVDYIFKQEKCVNQVVAIADYINSILKDYIVNSKDNLNVGIGCTGGKHRSVASAELIRRVLSERKISVQIEHRDIELI